MKFLNKHELKDELGVPSTRIIDQWVQRGMISSHKLGHRTRLFCLDQVLKDLSKFEIRAVGRKE